MIPPIRRNEPLARALGRLARTLLGRAAYALNNHREQAGERIHEMRTSLKKVRALMRLARQLARPQERQGIRRELRRAERRLRDLARHTAEIRDAEVVVQALDGVMAARPDAVKPETVKRVRQHLLQRFRRAAQEFQTAGPPAGAGRAADDRNLMKQARSPLETLATLLMQERRLTHDWTPSRPRSWSKSADRIADGMARTYRRARRSMDRAYTQQTAQQTGAAFHAWRKAVKAHRYQLQLLSNTWPGWVTARVPELERLGDLLGEEHDLTVLQHALANCPGCFDNLAERDSVLAVLEARQQQLRDEARPLGERLFSERTRLFRGQVQQGMRPPPAEGPTVSAAVADARSASDNARKGGTKRIRAGKLTSV